MIINILYLIFLVYMFPQIAIMTASAIAALFTRSYKAEANPQNKFAVLVPAHNEQDTLATTLDSLKQIDYPSDLFRVTVIADNCTDKTAQLAKTAGVDVVERIDEQKKSKGHALEWFFNRQTADRFDAFVIIDADTVVSDNILQVFNNELLRGKDIIQAFYGVSNPDASWRTELLTYALSLFNGIYLAGFNGLGLGCALRGNGMCFSTDALEKVPWKAASLAEDMEYSWTARLAGIKAQFTDEARVYGQMVSKASEGAKTQRKRWEEGRQEMRDIFKNKLLESKLPALEKALYYGDLMLDPLSKYGLKLLSLLILAGFATTSLSLIVKIAFLSLCLYLYLPLYRSYIPLSYLYSLKYVPRYVLWKSGVMKEKGDGSWKKTPREK